MEDSKNNYSDESYVTDDYVDAGDGTEKEVEGITIELMEKPFDPTLIKIETKQPSLDLLIKRIRRNSIQMDTSDYFQRQDDLWDKTHQSRLIESILIRFPLPAFFFDASDDDNWLIVDGLQRLSSVRNFVLGNQPLSNLEFLTHLNGKRWNDLPDNLQRQIEETQVVIYKIMPGTPADVKFNIFKRINTGGLVLESQEIRHALFQGKPSKFISELANLEEFKKATDHKIKTHRMLDRDFANRFLAFYELGVENYGSKEYGQDLDTFMSKAMASVYDKTDDDLDIIKLKFANSMKLAKSIFGKETFRKVYRDYKRIPPINKALFDAISTQFAFLNNDEVIKLKENKAFLKKQLKTELSNDEAFFKSLTSSTGNKGNTQYRHHKIQELIQNAINQ